MKASPTVIRQCLSPRRQPFPLAPIAVAPVQFARAVGCAPNTAIAFPQELVGIAAEKDAAGVRPAGKALPEKLPDA